MLKCTVLLIKLDQEEWQTSEYNCKKATDVSKPMGNVVKKKLIKFINQTKQKKLERKMQRAVCSDGIY